MEPVATATKEHPSGWLEDLDEEADEEDFHLLYNSYSGDDLIYSDSKVNSSYRPEMTENESDGCCRSESCAFILQSDDGMAEHLSDHVSVSDQWKCTLLSDIIFVYIYISLFLKV